MLGNIIDFYKNLIFPRNSLFKVPHSFDINQEFENYTPAIKMMLLDYVDPLALNFKILLNPYSKSGLLAGADKLIFDTSQDVVELLEDDKNFPTDSALAFLIRIGERKKALLLARWIQVLFDLVRNYEFLVVDVEGLDEIKTIKPEAAFVDAKFKINFRETSDSRVQSIIETYNSIWYDKNLNHVVLPVNLRTIDISILIFNAGYYNESFYGEKTIVADDKEKMEREMFPTIKKLNKLGNFPWANRDGTNPPPFIYHLFSFPSAIICTETGNEYFSSISNEPGNADYVKTSLSFDFLAVNYSNCFTNTFGAVDINQILLSMTKIGNISGMGFYDDQIFRNSYESIFTDRIFQNWGSKFKDSWKGLGSSLLNSALNLSAKYVESMRMWANNIADSIIVGTDPALLRNLTEKSLTNLMISADDKLWEALRMRDMNNFMRVNLSDRALNYWYDYEAYLLGKINYNNINKPLPFNDNSNKVPFGVERLSNSTPPMQSGHVVHYVPDEINEVNSGVLYNPAVKMPIESEKFSPQLFNISSRKNF